VLALIKGIITMSSDQKRSFMDFLFKFLAIIGSIAIIAIVIISITFIMIRHSRTAVPSKAVIEIDFSPGIVETTPEGIVNRFFTGNVLTISDIVTALDLASSDRRIKGIIAHIDGGPFAFADVQEIREAVIRFRKSGKPAVAFSETFGESGVGNSLFYLASAFDSIYLQPSGEVSITGFVAMTPFIKGMLDSLAIKPQIAAREEYKTAKNLFTESSYTDAQREMNTDIINAIRSQFIKDISDSRKIGIDTMAGIVATGPYGASEALRIGLVDGLEYKDQVDDLLKKRTGTMISFISFSRYIAAVKKPGFQRGKSIALIYGDGTIVSGKSRYNPLTGSKTMGARTITAAFRAAIKNRSTGAIIFRVNSPGGSYVASDMIRREIARARDAGKPVIVTMGAVAGSGGYFISVDATKIIAHPATLTGSIGVFGGKMVTTGFYNKLGITFDHVATDSNALLYSSMHEYSPEQWNYLQSRMDTVYADFINKVAKGRNMSAEQVKELAKGRVYTGDEAAKSGLVDTLGGLFEAFSITRDLLGIPRGRKVAVKVFPEKRTLWNHFSKENDRENTLPE
jgi:protease-4